MQRVVDVEAGEIGDDMIGDGVGRAFQFDAVADDVEHAAPANARRSRLVDEMHRHLDRDRRSGDEPQEIDVQRPVGDRIDLEVARQRADGLAVDGDFRHRGHEAAGMDLEVELAEGEGDRNRGFFAAIDDGRDHALTTDCAGGPLAHLVADRRRELVTGAHRTTP